MSELILLYAGVPTRLRQISRDELAIPGIAVGWLLSVGAAATLARSLYHVSGTDPLAWGGATAVVVIV